MISVPRQARHLTWSKDPLNDAPERVQHDLLTPEEAAERLKVSAEHVRALIRSGQLAAANIAIGTKRPLYRIRADVVAEFLNKRTEDRLGTNTPPRFRRLPPVEDHFPQLR